MFLKWLTQKIDIFENDILILTSFQLAIKVRQPDKTTLLYKLANGKIRTSQEQLEAQIALKIRTSSVKKTCSYKKKRV